MRCKKSTEMTDEDKKVGRVAESCISSVKYAKAPDPWRGAHRWMSKAPWRKLHGSQSGQHSRIIC